MKSPANRRVVNTTSPAPGADAGPSPQSGRFKRLERVAPLGYFAMGVGWLTVRRAGSQSSERMLAIANGSDWTPQPLTLHRVHPTKGVGKLPHWFSADYDHHMGLAVGDLNGNGFDDVVVAVFAGKDQDLGQGGVKVYLGGPDGLNPTPVWLVSGFAATSVALGDFTGSGTLDIIVSCLCEGGTIQQPTSSSGIFQGRARLLENMSPWGARGAQFHEHTIDHPAAAGAGDVAVADVDLDGEPDVVFAGHRTAVLYGRPDLTTGRLWDGAPVWMSLESHPFSLAAQPFEHPSFPGSQLVASSRGLFSASQLEGRSISEIDPGIFIHRPERNQVTSALQSLAGFDASKPEVPAGLTIVNDADGLPWLVGGFLDARGRDIRGAPLRLYPGSSDGSTPFEAEAGETLAGGGLMVGRVIASPYAGGPSSIQQFQCVVGPHEESVVTLPHRPAGELLHLEVDGAPSFQWSRSSDGNMLCFSPSLPPGAVVTASFRTTDEVEIVATSSAAWPPAGASGFWRGRLGKDRPERVSPSTLPPPNTPTQRAG